MIPKTKHAVMNDQKSNFFRKGKSICIPPDVDSGYHIEAMSFAYSGIFTVFAPNRLISFYHLVLDVLIITTFYFAGAIAAAQRSSTV